MADRHRHQPVDPVGVQPGEHPRERRAPVVPDDVRALDSERVEDRDDVGRDRRDPVAVDLLRPVGLAEAAQVGRDHAEAGVGERRRLLPPQVRRVREAVQEDYRRPLALDVHRERDAVGRVDALHAASFAQRRYGPRGRRTANAEVASTPLIIQNTDDAPALPATTPAAAGAATWPSRLPVRRTASALARACSGTSCTTIVIESGCANPSARPSARASSASTTTSWVTVRALSAAAAAAAFSVISVGRPRRRTSRLMPRRDASDAAARSASRAPTTTGAMCRCAPITGMYAVKTSVAERAAMLAKIAGATPRVPRIAVTAGAGGGASAGARTAPNRSSTAASSVAPAAIAAAASIARGVAPVRPAP